MTESSSAKKTPGKARQVDVSPVPEDSAIAEVPEPEALIASADAVSESTDVSPNAGSNEEFLHTQGEPPAREVKPLDESTHASIPPDPAGDPPAASDEREAPPSDAARSELAEGGEQPGDQTAAQADEPRVEPPAHVTVAIPNLPPPPEALVLNDLQASPLPRLMELAEKYGLRLGHERSRHQVIFELLRRLLQLGTSVEADGILEMTNSDQQGLLRWPRYNFAPCPEDVYVGPTIVKPHRLRASQRLRVSLRPPRDTREKHLVAAELLTVEEQPASEWEARKHFDELTPCHPRERLALENQASRSVSSRAVDLIAPLGKGQRGLIVAPPRAGKTILLKEIAKSIQACNQDVKLLVLLVDERPEEVTDFERSVDAEIYSSTFDEPPTRHVQVAELLGERAKRLVELGRDVVILIDSITRLSRGYNNLQPGKGRIMSGGVESKALMKPKRFFSSARNVEEGGSLTILATALVDTESRMDEVIFEEFKGTGNMELHLDRELIERRIYPAIHIPKSGTRKEELLYHPDEFQRISVLRKQLLSKPPFEAMEELVDAIKATRTNVELLLTGLR